MNAYELAKAQQAYSPPTLEEIIKQQADRIAELEKAAQRMVDEFAPHADKCRPCTIEWQNLRSVLVKGIR